MPKIANNVSMSRQPNLLDPEFEPTDQELAQLMRGFLDDVLASKPKLDSKGRRTSDFDSEPE